MRASAILGEAWRNLASGTTRSLLLAALLAVVVGALALADAATVTALQDRAEQFRDSGAAIRTLVAEDQVDGTGCDALASTDAVGSSGAIAATDPVTFRAMPAGSVPGFTTSPGLAAVLGLSPARPAGVWVSEQLAQTLRATAGSTLPTTAGPLTIAGVFPWPDDGRDSRFGYAVLIPTRGATGLDECWATIWPTSEAGDTLLRTAARVDVASTTPLSLSQVNKNHGPTFDGSAQLLDRLTRGVPVVGALVGLLLGYAACRLRRLEYAGARHAGARATAVVATALVETLAWSLAGALVALGVLAVVARQDPATAALVLVTSGRTVLVAVVACLGGAALALATIRERHLFRFFKDR